MNNLGDTASQMRRDYGPDITPQDVLDAASNEALVSSLLGLTHRIRTYEGKRGRTSTEVQHATHLRTQRDLVRAEILRRMGA